MYDDAYTRNDEGELAVRTVNVTEGSSSSSYDDVFTRDTNGKLALRVTGGGSGDSHNKGYYATPQALAEAYPTGEAGDYAIVGSTDTVWLWDEDTSAWVDSDQKGQVVSVNSKTGTVVLTAEDVGALPQYSTMPVASSSNSGLTVQYTGATNASYTHDYIYENVATTTPSSATASQTTGSSLTDVAVVVATFETQITTSGSYVFTSDGADWSYDGNVVDLTDYGITYTGTPVADDAITVVYTAELTSYAWTRVDVQPAPSGLPDQTGNSGKFLTTDGTDASWSDKIFVNNTVAIGNNTTYSSGSAVVIGSGAASTSAYSSAVSIGKQASADQDCVTIGRGAKTLSPSSVCLGSYTNSSSKYTIVIASGGPLEPVKATARGAIQLGTTGGTTTNSDANTFKVANANGNFEMMSADGTIPHGRLTNALASTTVTIAVADWNGGTTVSKTVSGLTATSVVFASPDGSSMSEWASAGVYASGQATDTLTFTASSTPTASITVVVAYC